MCLTKCFNDPTCTVFPRGVDSCKQICDLPRAIILRILAFLPIEDAASIPSLVFDEDHYCGNMPFGNFVERVLLLRDLSSIKAFSLTCLVYKEEYYDGNESQLRLHLPVDCRDTVYMLPHCMFRYETLRELHLEMNCDLKLPSSVCLTNLKVLSLTEVWFEDDNSVEMLLSCPSLEKLSLDRCIWDLEVLQISAPNLLYLTIVEEVLFSSYQNFQVRIHGASVKSFDYFGLFLYDYIVLTSSSGTTVEIKAKAQWYVIVNQGVAVASKNDDWISYPLPPCFTSSLKEIVICYFQGSNWELLAVRIFLRTAAVLEKLLIYCLNGHLWCYQGNLMEHLNELPRASNQSIIFLEEGHCSTIRKRWEFDDM
ncbi:hypothetical protein BT93_L2493 [Corymbia citriodora subsp. variegata]|uniref:F-box/LRR-repeat protein 15/At3g58940/PEG3-like LRR domain-containing protein n=1 Tax=Corymbia citriodora subsp. variegata TaxID=360336 RepID=A0A8T0CJW1_CORYI|nr:hypothetical protein BT93_L2493 [Corymbia citriodora subsp. variegata]